MLADELNDISFVRTGSFLDIEEDARKGRNVTSLIARAIFREPPTQTQMRLTHTLMEVFRCSTPTAPSHNWIFLRIIPVCQNPRECFGKILYLRLGEGVLLAQFTLDSSHSLHRM